MCSARRCPARMHPSRIPASSSSARTHRSERDSNVIRSGKRNADDTVSYSILGRVALSSDLHRRRRGWPLRTTPFSQVRGVADSSANARKPIVGSMVASRPSVARFSRRPSQPPLRVRSTLAFPSARAVNVLQPWRAPAPVVRNLEETIPTCKPANNRRTASFRAGEPGNRPAGQRRGS